MWLFKKFKTDSETTAVAPTLTEYGDKRAQDVNVLSNGGYDELLIAILNPAVRGNAYYNLLPANFRTLTSGTGAASGSENATIILNDVEYTVPLTTGTTAHNAYEIATYLTANATGWNFFQNDKRTSNQYS